MDFTFFWGGVLKDFSDLMYAVKHEENLETASCERKKTLILLSGQKELSELEV